MFNFFSYTQDNSVTSNVHSSNENLYEDQLSTSSTPSPQTTSSNTTISIGDGDLAKHQQNQNEDVYNTTNSHACIMSTLSIVSNFSDVIYLFIFTIVPSM